MSRGIRRSTSARTGSGRWDEVTLPGRSPAAPRRRSTAWRGLWRAVVIAGFVAAVLVHVFRPSDLAVAIAFIGVEAGAALVAWTNSVRAPREQRLPNMLVAAGLTSNVLGELAWYTLVNGSAETDVSLADVGWLVAYVFLGARARRHVVALARARQLLRRRLGHRRADDRHRQPPHPLEPLDRRHRRRPVALGRREGRLVDLPDRRRTAARTGDPAAHRPEGEGRHRQVVRGRRDQLARRRPRLPRRCRSPMPTRRGRTASGCSARS